MEAPKLIHVGPQCGWRKISCFQKYSILQLSLWFTDRQERSRPEWRVGLVPAPSVAGVPGVVGGRVAVEVDDIHAGASDLLTSFGIFIHCLSMFGDSCLLSSLHQLVLVGVAVAEG